MGGVPRVPRNLKFDVVPFPVLSLELQSGWAHLYGDSKISLK